MGFLLDRILQTDYLQHSIKQIIFLKKRIWSKTWNLFYLGSQELVWVFWEMYNFYSFEFMITVHLLSNSSPTQKKEKIEQEFSDKFGYITLYWLSSLGVYISIKPGDKVVCFLC